jgi:hypothetical protein
MTVAALLAAYAAGTVDYSTLPTEQQLEIQLAAAQGYFRGMSSGTSIPRPPV